MWFMSFSLFLPLFFAILVIIQHGLMRQDSQSLMNWGHVVKLKTHFYYHYKNVKHKIRSCYKNPQTDGTNSFLLANV